MTANQMYARLVEMRNVAGANLYDRLKLARDLLADRGWVTDPAGGGGDEGAANDRLEDECFGDCGMDLPRMLELLRAVPQASAWKSNKYNLRRMYAEMKARRDAARPTPTSRSRSSESPGGGTTSPSPPSPPSKDDLIAALKAELAETRQQLRETERKYVALQRVVDRLRALLPAAEDAA